jgi:hypothetical protein
MMIFFVVEKLMRHRHTMFAPRSSYRARWQFTVFYSNTALAHQLNRNRDWVVIYFHTDSYAEGQRTVVTETQGRMQGKRVVRSLESVYRHRSMGHGTLNIR